jgi:hypothetical protein
MNGLTVNVIATESPARSAPLPTWDAFEQALASALSVLADETLIVSARVGNRFVQFNACPDEGVFCESVSNAYLDPAEKLDDGQLAALLSLGWSAPTHAPNSPAPVSAPKGSPNFFREFPTPYSCSEIARHAVRTLTDIHRIPGPDDLEYKAFDDSGHGVTLPVLPIDPAPAPPPRAKVPPKRRGPTEFAKLRARVLAAARSGSGLGSLTYEDGALQISIGSRPGWIRPFEDPFYVRVHVQLLANVHPDEKFLARMHEVNSCLPVVRVIYRNGSVFLGVDFPAVPFRPEHLTQAVTAIAQLADAVLKDIRAPGDDAAVTVVN